MILRPWGHVDWLLGKLGDVPWSLLACCGSETRSIALAQHLGRHRLRSAEIVAIHDAEPLNPHAHKKRLLARRDSLLKCGYRENEIRDVELLAGLDDKVEPLQRLIAGGSTRLIIDVTSFPKVWFFPIIQTVLDSNHFEDVVVTYTSAVTYSDNLSENLAPLRALPGFFAEDGRSKHDSIIVGIGFEPLGLIPLLKNQESNKIKLIFPFPPGPPGHLRNWMFVQQIEELTQNEQIDAPDRVHIDMYDCPQIFDALCKMTNDGDDTAAIAPYGPKTVSLAMCLFALSVAAVGKSRVPIYYAQPHRYALDYTSGVRMRGNVPEITGYCLRLGNRDLYTLPS
ncbi:hypothetical protein F4X86_01665 [Candidatus Saccharibacteria bacterium]|nr:hypothetical protein [Gammaproteobacteria bacterium]MYB39988.1 hypothetical protein [Candidatus Saccharibacteria bacterium]